MASPFGKAGLPFVDGCGGTSNGFTRFEDEMKVPFQQTVSQRSFASGNASPFRVSSDRHERKDPFQQSTHSGGSSTTGSSILGHASTSSFSFVKGSPFSVTSKIPQTKNPFQQSTPLGGESRAWGSSQTRVGNSGLGHVPTSSSSNGNTSPFTFKNGKHVLGNPLQRSKVAGGGGSLASENDQTTTDTFGHAPFSSGKSLLLVDSSDQHEPEKCHSSTSSFSFGGASPFPISSNAHKPELKNPFQISVLPGGGSSTLSSLSQIEARHLVFGRASTSFGTPFGQPAYSPTDQSPQSPFGPALPKVSPQNFWRLPNTNDNSVIGMRQGGFVCAPAVSDNRSPIRQNPSLTSPFLVFGTPLVTRSVSIDSGKDATGMAHLQCTNFDTQAIVCECVERVLRYATGRLPMIVEASVVD